MGKILVIDDDPGICQLVKLLVQQAGHSVRTTQSGEMGLEMIQESVPDVVLLDMFMPNKDGLEILQEIRHRFPAVRVVAMSGGGVTSQIQILQAAMQLGAAQTLVKPFNAVDLIGALEKQIDQDE